MKRQYLLAVLAAAALMGCRAENGTDIEITGRAVASDEKTCAFATGGKVRLGNGVYDPLLGGPYILPLYVQNNLTDPKIVSPGTTTQSKGWRPEQVRIRVNPKEYTDLYQPSPALAAIPFAESVLPVAASSVAEPAGGQAIYIMSIITDGLLVALQGGAGAGGTIVLGITLQGRTNDGARLDSNEWPFPIEIQPVSFVDPSPCPTGTTLASACDGQTNVVFCQ